MISNFWSDPAKNSKNRRFYASYQRHPNGVVDAWLHMEPASVQGMSSENIGGIQFQRYEAAEWSDEEVAAQVREWAKSVLAKYGITEDLS